MVVKSLVIMLLLLSMQLHVPKLPFISKRVRGNKMYGGQSTHLPLRLNQAGVIPLYCCFQLSYSLLISIFSCLQKNAVLSGLRKQ